MRDGPRAEEIHTLLSSPRVMALRQYTPADRRASPGTTAIVRGLHSGADLAPHGAALRHQGEKPPVAHAGRVAVSDSVGGTTSRVADLGA